MQIKPFRKLVKVYHGLVSSNRLKDQRPSDNVDHIETKCITPIQNEVFTPIGQHDGEAPASLAITDLRRGNISLHHRSLTAESLLVLRLTCQNIQRRILLPPSRSPTQKEWSL